jgi:hypothetical protein
MQGSAGSKQRLGWHAGPKRAFAAHEFGFHQHRGEAALYNPVCDVFPGGTGSDHNDIEFPLNSMWRHGNSLRPPSP